MCSLNYLFKEHISALFLFAQSILLGFVHKGQQLRECHQHHAFVGPRCTLDRLHLCQSISAIQGSERPSMSRVIEMRSCYFIQKQQPIALHRHRHVYLVQSNIYLAVASNLAGTSMCDVHQKLHSSRSRQEWSLNPSSVCRFKSSAENVLWLKQLVLSFLRSGDCHSAGRPFKGSISHCIMQLLRSGMLAPAPCRMGDRLPQ